MWPVSFLLYSDGNGFQGVKIPVLTVLSLVVLKAYGIAWRIQSLRPQALRASLRLISQLGELKLEDCCQALLTRSMAWMTLSVSDSHERQLHSSSALGVGSLKVCQLLRNLPVLEIALPSFRSSDLSSLAVSETLQSTALVLLLPFPSPLLPALCQFYLLRN